MIPLPVDELAGLGRLETAGDEITGLQVDSRRIEPGDLFVAIGAGTAFLDDARARGATATLVPADAHEALALISGLVRDRSAATFVAITGSMGKTTTKDILEALCAPHARTVAAESSYNNEIGVPLTLCRVEPDTEICILELAMRGFGQIAALAAFSRPELGVITSIGPVHLEKVGTVDGVRRAKAELIEALPPGGTAIVPADFPVARDDLTVVRVGEDVRLEAFEPSGDHARVVTSLGTIEVNFTMRHLAENVLYALAAYRALGLPLEQAGEGASAIAFADWRNQELPLPGGGLLINDSWNANPVSMRAALEHLRERAAGRRTIAVLGEMAELGDYSAEAHREVALAIGQAGIDVVVAVGPRAQVYGGSWVAGADQAAGLLRDLLQPGDCVLVKGARALALEGIAAGLANVAS